MPGLLTVSKKNNRNFPRVGVVEESACGEGLWSPTDKT